jgi:hypothetical protein
MWLDWIPTEPANTNLQIGNAYHYYRKLKIG